MNRAAIELRIFEAENKGMTENVLSDIRTSGLSDFDRYELTVRLIETVLDDPWRTQV